MKRPHSSPTTYFPNKKRRSFRIEPYHWNRNHLVAVGATVGFELDLPTEAPPSKLLDAVVNTSYPLSTTFSSLHHTVALRGIAEIAYRLIELNPTVNGTELRQCLCAELIERVLCYLCPRYEFSPYPLELHYHAKTVTWNARGLIGSHFWLVVPIRHAPDFAEEAAFVLSLAQEFMDPDEEGFEVWLVSVRAGKAAVIKATVARSLLSALESNRVVESGKLIGPKRALRMEVSKEFQIMDEKERVGFLEVLIGLGRMANEMRDGEGQYIVAASW